MNYISGHFPSTNIIVKVETEKITCKIWTRTQDKIIDVSDIPFSFKLG